MAKNSERYGESSSGSTKINNTSRDVGAKGSPAPSSVRADKPGLRTQLEIGGGLGNTTNDQG